ELETADNVVVSTGGGIVMQEKNMISIKKNAIIVFLKNDFETSQKRVDKKNPPPLFRDIEKAKKLHTLRLALYIQYADITVETDTKSKEEIVEEIINKIDL